MRPITTRALLLALTAFATLPASAAPARPAYRRAVPRESQAGPSPQAAPLPAALRAEAVAAVKAPPPAAPDNRAPGAARTRPPARVPQAPDRGSEAPAVRLAADQAARWAAVELTERYGRREYFRVGFYTGLREALDDPRLGHLDRLQGRRDGDRDLEARDLGYDLGRSAAAEQAIGDAQRRVRDQFLDLYENPRFRTTRDIPPFAAPPVQVDEPTLQEVLADYPLRQFTPFGERWALLADWSLEPWQIYRCAAYTDFFDGAWLAQGFALELWLRDGPRSAVYRGLRTPADRERFAQAFHVALARELRGLFDLRLQRSYERGLDDGWVYGAYVRGELAYRQAYAEAFRASAVDASRVAFAREYPLAYEDAYRRAFADWSEHPKPEIARVVLRDADDDGVFQPGERLFADVELINYGGVGGHFRARLSGDALSDPGSAELPLPARERVSVSGMLQAAIDPRVPSGTRAMLELSLLDARSVVPLLVSWPLELRRGTARLQRDDLDGRVGLSVAVFNRSRRALDASVSVTSDAAPGLRLERRVEAIAPQDEARVDFTVTGLHPLDLIGGTVDLDVEVRRADTRHGRLDLRLPETASNLGNRDLLRQLVVMAREGDASPSEIERARELLLARLREDWRASIRANGNPYKSDQREKGRRTALGDLAQTYLAGRAGFTRPEVFLGLERDVTLLSRELPGAHPFLRKSMRKLARVLP